MRLILLIGLGLSLSSCSYRLDVAPCREGQRLAFRIAEKPGLLWGASPQRLWKIVVYKRYEGTPYSAEQERWHTEDLHDDRDGYTRVVYGSQLEGWSVLTPPQTLQQSQEYWATIVAEGGAGADISFIPSKVVTPCEAAITH